MRKGLIRISDLRRAPAYEGRTPILGYQQLMTVTRVDLFLYDDGFIHVEEWATNYAKRAMVHNAIEMMKEKAVIYTGKQPVVDHIWHVG